MHITKNDLPVKIDAPGAHARHRPDFGVAAGALAAEYFTLGAGVRIPIVRWMSFVASFDWSFVGLSVRGDDPSTGNRFQSWIGGQQLAGTFALTFHFLGVRGD